MVDTAALRAEARVYEELGQNCYLSKSSALLLLDELDAARARIAELEGLADDGMKMADDCERAIDAQEARIASLETRIRDACERGEHVIAQAQLGYGDSTYIETAVNDVLAALRGKDGE